MGGKRPNVYQSSFARTVRLRVAVKGFCATSIFQVTQETCHGRTFILCPCQVGIIGVQPPVIELKLKQHGLFGTSAWSLQLAFFPLGETNLTQAPRIPKPSPTLSLPLGIAGQEPGISANLCAYPDRNQAGPSASPKSRYSFSLLATISICSDRLLLNRYQK